MINPELRRNLWLEITTHRLLAMPAVLGLAFLVLAAIDKPNAVEHVSWLGMGGFGLLAMLWGSRLAANSIIDEMLDKTWDWQRLSTLGPWTMTWGKLFGSTAFAWYGGLICLAVFLVTASATTIRSPLQLGICVVLLAIMLHAATLAAALHTSRTGVPANRRSIGILLVFLLLYIVPVVLAQAWGKKEAITWYGSEFAGLDFLLASSAVFCAWAVAGAYRAMCQSLAVRTTPWVWASFLLFVTAYSAGFAIADVEHRLAPTQALALAGLIWGLLFTYLMLFTEPTGPLVLRRVAQKVRQQQWTRAWQEIPCWPVTWLFAVLFALALAVHGANSPNPGWRQLAMAPIPTVLLAARDAAIFLFFAAASQPRRVAGTTIVYMLLLYWILPGLLNALGLKQMAELVFPFGEGDSWAQVASALIQAGIAGWLAYRRVQVNFSSWRRADGV
jgi:hypothetical protein